MAKNEIKLQYSGFIIFAAKMLSVATGLLFQLMIARSTTKSEYDLWFNLNDILAYFTLLATAIPFWTMRFVAREKEGAVKTGIIANLLISAIATAIYISLVPFITSSLNISQEYLLLYFVVGVQIVELYSLNALQWCLRARKPQVVGYGLLIAEICKVALGYVFIIQFQQPLVGALISLITAYTVQIGYYFRLFAAEMKQHIRWQYVKEWIKGSLANIYHVIGNQIVTFILIMLFVYGGEGARGRHGLARQVASVITYSSFLAFALYPRLIAEKKREDIATSLKMVLMFAIPMTAGAIALSDSYIVIMKSIYQDAWPVLVVLAVDGLVITISTLFQSILFGVESVDEGARISFKELVRSRLFILFSLPYLHSAIALPTSFYVLTNYVQGDPLQAAISISVINTVTRLVTFFVLWAVVRKMIKVDIPWRSLGKYVLASVVMSAFLVFVDHPKRIHMTLILTGIAGIIYWGFLMAIEKDARLLVKSAWQEIRVRTK